MRFLLAACAALLIVGCEQRPATNGAAVEISHRCTNFDYGPSGPNKVVYFDCDNRGNFGVSLAGYLYEHHGLTPTAIAPKVVGNQWGSYSIGYYVTFHDRGLE